MSLSRPLSLPVTLVSLALLLVPRASQLLQYLLAVSRQPRPKLATIKGTTAIGSTHHDVPEGHIGSMAHALLQDATGVADSLATAPMTVGKSMGPVDLRRACVVSPKRAGLR
jgi:hypothetical protein